MSGYATRTVVGIDPPIAAGMCGIVAAIGGRGGIEVLGDQSAEALAPQEWAHRAAVVAGTARADCIVIAGNQHEILVRAILKQCTDVPIRIHRTQKTRPQRVAELVALNEAGAIRFTTLLPDLERDLRNAMWPETPRNRIDALMLAVEELTAPPQPRVMRF